MKKAVSIDELKPGMFLVGVDQPWFTTPFLSHRWRIRSQEDIEKLRASGVKQAFIDPEQGEDVEEPPKDHPASVSQGGASKITPSADPGDASDASNVAHSAQQSSSEERVIAHRIYEEAVGIIEDVFDGVKTGVPMDGSILTPIVHSLKDCLVNQKTALFTEMQLQLMQRLDKTLFAHVVGVAGVALAMAQEAGLNESEILDIGKGALLHDIGQTRLPQNLLQKPRPLTPQEQKLFESHPKLGATILSGKEGMSKAMVRMVLEHHERLDGSGFPAKLVGQNSIHSFSQLVGLVDYYVGLLAGRGENPAMLPAQAILQIYQDGIYHKFDMPWIQRLIQCLGVYPIGSLVALESGEWGWVIAVNPSNTLLPTVKLLWEPDGSEISPPRIVDLSAIQDGASVVKIREPLNAAQAGVSEETWRMAVT